MPGTAGCSGFTSVSKNRVASGKSQAPQPLVGDICARNPGSRAPINARKPGTSVPRLPVCRCPSSRYPRVPNPGSLRERAAAYVPAVAPCGLDGDRGPDGNSRWLLGVCSQTRSGWRVALRSKRGDAGTACRRRVRVGRGGIRPQGKGQYAFGHRSHAIVTLTHFQHLPALPGPVTGKSERVLRKSGTPEHSSETTSYTGVRHGPFPAQVPRNSGIPGETMTPALL